MEPAIPRLRRDHDEVNGVRRRYRLDDMRAMASRAGLAVRRATHANSFLVPPAAALALAHRVKRPGARSASDFERDRLGPLFGALAAAERRVHRAPRRALRALGDRRRRKALSRRQRQRS